MTSLPPTTFHYLVSATTTVDLLQATQVEVVLGPDRIPMSGVRCVDGNKKQAFCQSNQIIPPLSRFPLHPSLIRSIFAMRLQGVTDSLEGLSLGSPHRILVVGCAYGGISAVLNLLDFAQGKSRQSVYPGPDFNGAQSRRGVDITVIDERDGYCASAYTPPLAEAQHAHCYPPT